MLAVGALMLKGRGDPGNPRAECNREKAPTVVACGLGSGLFSGFFGIGGGFLVVPGLVASTGMQLLFAVGTSLVAVTAFGLTTRPTTLFQDWSIGRLPSSVGTAGSLAGTRLAARLGKETGKLAIIFAMVVFTVAAYMMGVAPAP